MKLLLLLFIVVASLSLQSCSGCKNTTNPKPDNPYGLPNATQTGSNTMGCLVNGTPTILQQSFNSFSYPMSGIFGDTLLQFDGVNTLPYYQSLTFSVRNPIVGSFQISNNLLLSYGAYMTFNTCNGFKANPAFNGYTSNGIINITKLDKVNHIVSGTFSCKIPIPNCDTLNINEGRFDIWLQIK